MVSKEQILQWLQAFAAEIEQNKTYLTELDAAIGDAVFNGIRCCDW